jgi:hypothetical protein
MSATIIPRAILLIVYFILDEFKKKRKNKRKREIRLISKVAERSRTGGGRRVVYSR